MSMAQKFVNSFYPFPFHQLVLSEEKINKYLGCNNERFGANKNWNEIFLCFDFRFLFAGKTCSE